MISFALIIATIAGILLIFSAIAFLKAKDVFTMIQVAMIAHCYIIPLILLAAGIEKFSLLSFAKILVLIILNLILANLICATIARRALFNKISPDADYVK